MDKARESISIIIQIIISGLAVIITAYLLPGISVANFFTGIVIAAMLALLNMTIKPILVFLTIPITLITLGLFLLVINAFIVIIAAEIIPGFVVNGFWWAILFSVILSLINSLLGVFIKWMVSINGLIFSKYFFRYHFFYQYKCLKFKWITYNYIY